MSDAPAEKAKGVGEPVDAPEDVAAKEATGYAVYDRTIGQYVGDRTTSKPSQEDADKAVPEGHVAAVVRV